MNERDITKSIENIMPNPNLKEKVIMAALSSPQKWTIRKKLQVATCFSLFVLITLSGLRVGWTPTTTSPKNQFSLVAMAENQTESSVEKGKKINLSLINQTYGYQPMRARLDNGDEEWKHYGFLGLKCKGENIKSITYDSQEIDFAKIVLLDNKQLDILFNAYFKVDDLNGNFPNMQGTKKPEEIPEEYKVYPCQDWVDPYSNDSSYNLDSLYTAFPDAKKYEYYDKDFNESVVTWCYKTVGKSYTISYEDQYDFSKQFGYKVGKIVTRKEMAEMNSKAEKALKQGKTVKEVDHMYYSKLENDILKELDARLDGEILKVTVHFKDGSSQQKRFQLYYDEIWNLCIKQL